MGFKNKLIVFTYYINFILDFNHIIVLFTKKI